MFQPSSSSSSSSSSLLLVAFEPSKKKDAETLWVRLDRWEIIEKVRKNIILIKKGV